MFLQFPQEERMAGIKHWIILNQNFSWIQMKMLIKKVRMMESVTLLRMFLFILHLMNLVIHQNLLETCK